VWVDAHGDFNTEDSTPSAHLGGMPLAKLCGYGEQTLMRDYGCPVLRGEQVTHVCGRDFDSGERERMLEAGVVLGDLDTLPDEPVHLHIDLDVLAPDVLPCVNYPAPGGLSPDELTWFSCNLVRRGAVGITISAHDPRLDDGTGAAVLNHIVDAIASAMQENA
jgi:arginase